jgi:DNA helicase II / ATP-dependent DNA helicase PcrA
MSGDYPMASVQKFAPSIALDDELGQFEIRGELEQELERRLSESEIDARPALKSFEPTADEDQLSLIRASADIIRLVAPAGSGKTQTLINRMLHSTTRRPDRILCLTFDNAAGQALRDKVTSQIGTANAAQTEFQIFTLNAFGYRLLRQHFPQECQQIIEGNRVWRLIKEAKEDLASRPNGNVISNVLPETLKHGFYREFFSLLKNALFDPRDLRLQEFADFMLKAKAAEVFFQPETTTEQKKFVIAAVSTMFRSYDRILQREKRIDFDDQKLRTLRCLELSPNTLDVVQKRYDEIIVDEFQDINQLDFALIKQLSKQCRLVVTGDDDQAIYGFRGCSPSYIIDLERYLGRAVKSFELRRNYRCPANIVHHATRLIRNNTWRIEKNTMAVRTDDASIKIIESTTATAEAKMIATAIDRIKRRNQDLRYSDFAVLYRANAQSLPIQLQFILRDIPYSVREEDNILENDELEKLLGVLRMKLALESGTSAKPRDAILALKAYFRSFDYRVESRLEEYFAKLSPSSELFTGDRFYALVPKAKGSALREAISAVVKAPSLFKTLDVLAHKFKGLRGMVGSLEDVVGGDVPLGEVYELAASFRGKVDAFVDTVDGALRRAREARAGQERGGVVLATYFKAKGLQWHTVILTSCNQGLIPHRRAPIEDERKLFYVALTRASSNLFVSYLRTSCKTKVPRSCFLVEAGFN